MVTQLISHERIETTHPKAKELSRYADYCVSLAKDVRSLAYNAWQSPAQKSNKRLPQQQESLCQVN
jgi:ribosomal protein L17